MSTAPTAQNVLAQLLLGIGQIGQANNVGLNFSDLLTQVSSLLLSEKILTAGQTNIEIAFATLFPAITTPYVCWVQEVTGGTQNGFKVRHSNGGTAISINAGKMWIVFPGAMPDIFVDNGSGANSTYLQIGCIGT